MDQPKRRGQRKRRQYQYQHAPFELEETRARPKQKQEQQNVYRLVHAAQSRPTKPKQDMGGLVVFGEDDAASECQHQARSAQGWQGQRVGRPTEQGKVLAKAAGFEQYNKYQ